MSSNDQTARRPGRPHRGAEPTIDHALLERLMVNGEFLTTDDGGTSHFFPSFKELARRFGVSVGVIQRFAARHSCLERRGGSPSASGASAAVPPAINPARGAGALLLPTIREMFVKWVRDVQAGETRITSASEFEKMMRVAADLDAEAQMRALIPEGIRTLEELQKLHEERMRAYEASTPAERGRIPIGLDNEPDDELGAAEHDASVADRSEDA